MKRHLPNICILAVLVLGFASTFDPKLEKWCGISALGIALISAVYFFTKDDKSE